MIVLKPDKIINLISISLYNYIKKYHKDMFCHFNQKYKPKDLIIDILIILKSNLPWRKAVSSLGCDWNTLYKTYLKLINKNIIMNTYYNNLTKYLKKSPSKKLKLVYTDTTFIRNKYGSDLVAYNGYKKGSSVYNFFK